MDQQTEAPSIGGQLLVAAFALAVVAAVYFLWPESSPRYSDETFAKALSAIQKQGRVGSAAWQSKSLPSLVVGVNDTGASQDAYAQRLCRILAVHGIRGGVVNVIDKNAGKWREIGKAWCKE